MRRQTSALGSSRQKDVALKGLCPLGGIRYPTVLALGPAHTAAATDKTTTFPTLILTAALLGCCNRLASFHDHTVGERKREKLTGSSVPPLDFMVSIAPNWIK